MKKYKLIKEYPGSPKLGIILQYCDKVHQAHTLDKKNYYNGMIITNYPEFWEEVVEKDYEILSYYAKNISGKGENYVDLDYIWYETAKGNGKWSRKGHITGPYTTDEINNHNGYGIYSVKKLSDGEVFTLGEEVKQGIIVEFKATCYRPYTTEIEVHFAYNRRKTMLNNLKKCKKPLFTTEDGVDIFEGDKIFPVNRTNFQHYDSNRVITSNFQQSSVYKYFSTKEAAEKYILMNKPCLSINDVLSINQWNLVETKTSTTNKLRKLVKSKL